MNPVQTAPWAEGKSGAGIGGTTAADLVAAVVVRSADCGKRELKALEGHGHLRRRPDRELEPTGKEVRGVRDDDRAGGSPTEARRLTT